MTLFVLTAIGWPLVVLGCSRRFAGTLDLRGARLSPIFTVGVLVEELSARGRPVPRFPVGGHGVGCRRDR